jgi:periplasmic divalent cation tolerance protein
LASAALLVLTQFPDRGGAQRLARRLVELRLAACVTVGSPVESLYHWRGAIETAQEIPVVIKTVADRYPEVEAAIREHHPYELPEIVAVILADGFAPFLDWIAAETAGR